MAHEDDTLAGSDRADVAPAPQVFRSLEQPPVLVFSPLPEDLPPAVADLFNCHGIVARGQAAAAIARLIQHADLRVAAAQDEADLRAALGLIGIAPEPDLQTLIAPFPTPPTGVPLDGFGTALHPDDATPDHAASVSSPIPDAGKPESEADHG